MRKVHFLALAVASVVVAAVGLATYYLIVRGKSQEELAAILAELDTNDPGWQRDDLDRVRLAVPAEEDSGPIILKLRRQVPANWFTDDPESHWNELAPNEQLLPADVAKFEQRMAKVRDVVVEARRLADKPRGRYPIAWTPDSISTLLPHLQDVREMASVLHHDAVWQAHNGKLKLALESCRAGLNVARSLDGEPILISQLVRAACVRVTLDGLHRTLAAGEADAESLLAVQKMLAEMDKHDSFVVGMRGDRAGMHILCTNLQNGTVSPRVMLALLGARGGAPSFTDRVEEIYVTASVPTSHVWILRHFTDVIAASKLPAAEQDVRLNELSPRGNQMPVFAKVVTPAWERCYETFRRDRARLRCATIALAVERYRLKHGVWPDDLAALVPGFLAAIPADPYTDQPLKFRKAPGGISVFSVGANHAMQGDFFDHRRAADAVGIAGESHASEFEFRLWDTDSRLR